MVYGLCLACCRGSADTKVGVKCGHGDDKFPPSSPACSCLSPPAGMCVWGLASVQIHRFVLGSDTQESFLWVSAKFLILSQASVICLLVASLPPGSLASVKWWTSLYN